MNDILKILYKEKEFHVIVFVDKTATVGALVEPLYADYGFTIRQKF